VKSAEKARTRVPAAADVRDTAAAPSQISSNGSVSVTTRWRFASTVVLHDGLRFIALALLIGHLYLALIHQATRHAPRGMTLGTVRAAASIG
jgi:hypothetical protein